MTAPVQALLRAVVRRERLADTAFLLARVALPSGLLIAAAAIAGARLLGISSAWAWLAIVPLPAVFAWAHLRPRSLRAVARRIDDHYALHDTIGNAVELERGVTGNDPRTHRIVELIIDTAQATAAELDPRPVVPLRVPRPRRSDALAVLALAAAAIVPAAEDEPSAKPDSSLHEAAPPTPTKPQRTDLSLAEPLRQDLRALKEGHDVAARMAEGLLEILDQLEAGTLDREHAFERIELLERELADAEERFEAELVEDPSMLSEALREVATAFEEQSITESAAEALEQGEAERLEEKLEEAGQAAESDDASRKSLAAAMKDAERRLAKEADTPRSTASELAEQERRLRREQQKKDKDPDEQERRLQQMRDRVEQLKRQHEREMAAQRRLEQLRRDANQSRDGKSASERREGRQRFSQSAGQASQQANRWRRTGQARDSLEEAKSFVRRSGRQGESERRRQGQARKFSRAAKGKRGKDGRGKSTLLVEGKVGDGDPQMMMEGEGGDRPGEGDGRDSGDGEGEGDGEGDGSDGDGTTKSPFAGDGIGTGAVDPLGDEQGKRGDLRNVRVNAEGGRGVSRAETIRTSSQEGFANEPYREIFHDYSTFAQSALDNEAMPSPRRRLVKRYFQLIQPRD